MDHILKVIKKNCNVVEFKLQKRKIIILCEPKDVFNILNSLIARFDVVEVRYFNQELNDWTEYEKFCQNN